jgi:rhodanese-related sulfurtransferase
MDRLNELITLARGRAAELKLAYAGAFTPKEASEVLALAPQAKLVDVRTRAELDWVGRVPGAVEVELMGYPGNALNALFAHQLEAATGKNAMLLFMCRSGGRSNMAATQLTAAGFGHCYNVLEGFEGERDANGQRNRTGGWRAAGLAWQQS